MVGFIIEQGDIVKEAFRYERQLNEASFQALVEYTHANYGADATLREMTPSEKANFLQFGAEFFKQDSEV